MRIFSRLLLPILLLTSCAQPLLPTATVAATIPPAATITASQTIQATAAPYRTGFWTYQTPYHWSHDGVPYESKHFIVYSDSARESEKKQFSEAAERSLAFIKDFLQITDSELHYPPSHKKIEIFGSSKHLDEMGGGYAYYVGFLFAYDQREYSISRSFSPYSFLYEPLFIHEITHDVGFLLIGYKAKDNLLVSTWFDEGLATYVGQDNIPYSIGSLSQLDSLRKSLEDIPGHGNPILINQWEDIPGQYFSDDMINKLYSLFELAVRYLVDKFGVEKCKQLYQDAREGISFEESFQNRYGMSLSEYQNNFFGLMEEYLH